MQYSRTKAALGGTLLFLGVGWWLRHTEPVAPQGALADVVERVAPDTTARSGSGPEILGSVVDPQGRPLVNSSVCWVPVGGLLASGDKAAVCRPTEGGFFRLAILPVRMIEVFAFAEGYSTSEGERGQVVDLDASLVNDLRLVLAPSAVAIRGMVKDVFGGVVEGAFVHTDNRVGPSEVAFTDDEGAFALWIRNTRGRKVLVDAEGYCHFEAAIHNPGQPLDVILEPGGTIAGRVVERRSRAAVAGARVFSAAGSVNETSASGVTDESGSFRLSGLRPGRYRPSAETDGRRGLASESLILSPGETVEELVIEVDPAPKITARVLTREDRSPVNDATVVLRAGARKVEFRETSGADGVVVFPSVWPGEYTIDFIASGRILPEPPYTLHVKESPLEGVEWLLERGGWVSGTTSDLSGKPVGEVFVEGSFPERLEQPGARTAAVSDSGGRFVLEGLRPYGNLEIYASHGEFGQVDAPLVLAYRDTRPVDGLKIVLEPSASLEGVVLDQRAAPVAQAAVLLYEESSLASRQVRAGADGQFSFAGLRRGRYRVVAGTAENSLMRPPVEDGDNSAHIDVSAGDKRSLELKIVAEVGNIAGVVKDAGGLKEGVIVTAQSQRELGFLRQSVTDDHGRFEFVAIPVDKYLLRAYDKDRARVELKDVRPGDPVTLSFESLASLCGALEGVRAGDLLRVQVSGARQHFGIDETFFAGRAWCVRDIVPGDVEIRVTYGPGKVLRRVQLSSGETKNISFSAQEFIQ